MIRQDTPPPPPPQRPELLSLRAAAEVLGLVGLVAEPERMVRRMVGRGELDGRRVGRFMLVTRRSVDRLVGGV